MDKKKVIKFHGIQEKVWGLLCLKCAKVLISWSHHDYKTCGCENEAMVDGGQSSGYIRYGAADMRAIQMIDITPTKVSDNVD